MEYQECKGCTQVFPKTNEYFTWEIKSSGILKKYCRDCFHAIAKVYREKYKKQKDDDMFNLVDITHQKKEQLMYKAFKVIYANAFGQLLTKAEYDKLKIVK